MAIQKALFAGDDATPDSVKRRMALAELLRQQGADTSHIDSPLEAIGSILQSGVGAWQQRKAEGQEKAGLARRASAQQALAAGLLGGGDMGTSTANSMSPNVTPQMGTGYKPSPAAGARAAAGDNTVIDRGAGSPSRQAFIQSLMPAAIEASKRTGVDPRLIVAQAAQETGWGRSAPGNNYFGIKSHGKDGGQNLTTHEVVNGQRVKVNDSFRTFASPADSVAGYADFLLQNPRYKPMMGAQGLDAQLEALGASGYATDPNYASSVGAIARSLPMPDLGGSPAPVQVASNDPSIGVAQATGGSPAAASAAAPAQNQQMAQMLTGGAPQLPSAIPPAMRAQIQQLLADPYTEDMGQQLLQQVLKDQQTRQQLGYKAQLDQAQTADERRYQQMTRAEQRAYDDQVRQAGYAREDQRNSYLDARQGSRDARSDMESDRNYDRSVRSDQKPNIITIFDEETGRERKGYLDPDNKFVPVGGVEAPKKSNGVVVRGPDGSLIQVGGDTPALTEGQSKDAVFSTRAKGALGTLDQYAPSLTGRVDRARDVVPFGLARGGQSTEYQLAKQAGNEFLQAILRKDTGAAITPDEEALYGVTYLPQPGDSEELLAQKQQSRSRAVAAIEAGMPPAAIIAQEKALQRSSSGVNMRPITAGVPQTQAPDKNDPEMVPEGVDPEDWKLLTPEERKLWR